MKKKIICILFFLLFFFVLTQNIYASNKIIETKTDDEIIFISDDNGKFLYSWIFDKKEYEKNEFEFDLGIDFKSKNENKIDGLISKKMKKEFISFNYHGNLPTKAIVKVPIEKFKDNERLNLYYYNEEENKIETVKTNIMVKNGFAILEIEHCSDYFFTKEIVKESENSKNSNGIIIIGMLIIIVGLVGYTLFNNKK